MKNIITKNFNWRKTGRDKPRIIQGGVVSKGLREEFSFRDRIDGSGAIRMK
ncbi:hypothetical protein E2C01_023851 [Portunus trituberculatus]|uniref:Uncharacterized protein n=1 Tax=Portunus trituberculatus TaxID=210409 RepID=A0A5B7EB61_PORTR|nr:hypothetical protein [Portunus trituberculatus]